MYIPTNQRRLYIKKKRKSFALSPLPDSDILEAYLRKNAHSRADARRIKRQMRKLFFAR